MIYLLRSKRTHSGRPELLQSFSQPQFDILAEVLLCHGEVSEGRLFSPPATSSSKVYDMSERGKLGSFEPSVCSSSHSLFFSRFLPSNLR